VLRRGNGGDGAIKRRRRKERLRRRRRVKIKELSRIKLGFKSRTNWRKRGWLLEYTRVPVSTRVQ